MRNACSGSLLNATLTPSAQCRTSVGVFFGISRSGLIQSSINGIGTPHTALLHKLPWANPQSEFKDGRVEEAKKILEEALAAPSHEKALEAWKKVQWDGTTGPESEKGDLPYIWLVTIDHTYYVKDDLDIPEQPLHPHGHGWPVICNLNEWKRK